MESPKFLTHWLPRKSGLTTKLTGLASVRFYVAGHGCLTGQKAFYSVTLQHAFMRKANYRLQGNIQLMTFYDRCKKIQDCMQTQGG